MFLIILADAPAPPQWQVVAGILAIPAAALGLFGAYRVNQKTRLETLKLQKELLGADEPGPADTSASPLRRVLASSRAISIGTQGFVIRFIVFYLAQWFWAELASVLFTPVALALAVMREHGLPALVHQVSFTAVAAISQIGSLLIFIVLGLPLLKDIMRYLGITWRDLYSRRTQGGRE